MNINEIKKNLDVWEKTLFMHSQFVVGNLLQNEYKNQPNVYDKILKPIRMGMVYSALELNNGNKSKTAKCLGISRTTLNSYLEQYFNNMSVYTLDVSNSLKNWKSLHKEAKPI